MSSVEVALAFLVLDNRSFFLRSGSDATPEFSLHIKGHEHDLCDVYSKYLYG